MTVNKICAETVRALINQGKRRDEIANEIGVREKSLLRFCRRNGIGIAVHSNVSKIPAAGVAVDVDNGLTNAEIAAKYGASVSAVESRLKLLGIKRPKSMPRGWRKGKAPERKELVVAPKPLVSVIDHRLTAKQIEELREHGATYQGRERLAKEWNQTREWVFQRWQVNFASAA